MNLNHLFSIRPDSRPPIRQKAALGLLLFFAGVFSAWSGFAAMPAPSPAAEAPTPALIQRQGSVGFQEQTQEKAPLVLALGEQRALRIPGLARYSLGSEVVRSLPQAKLPSRGAVPMLLLKAVRPGTAGLWVWRSDGSSEYRTIRVIPTSGEDLKPALGRALGKIEEAEILITGPGVILRGEIQTLSECARIRALSDQFPKEVIDETELSASMIEQGRKKLKSWLKSSRYSSFFEIEEENGRLLLRQIQGALRGPGERESLRAKLRSVFPGARLLAEALPDTAPTVHFKVYLLELKKNRFHSLGLTWPASQAGAFRVTSSRIQNLLQLDLTLQALEGDGSVRVLSNPELVVRAPGEAELFSGGELPIETKTQYSSNVSWKNFGLMLKLNVTHTAGDLVRLDVSTEVSHLDPAIGRNDLPGLQANRMKTQVDARFGKPLLLSGLLQQSVRRQARGLPLLRQIPILGALFGSEDYLNEKSELVAILVPNRNLPEAQMERVTPKGPVPPPRNWISPEDEIRLETSKNYPWNAFEEERT